MKCVMLRAYGDASVAGSVHASVTMAVVPGPGRELPFLTVHFPSVTSPCLCPSLFWELPSLTSCLVISAPPDHLFSRRNLLHSNVLHGVCPPGSLATAGRHPVHSSNAIQPGLPACTKASRSYPREAPTPQTWSFSLF